MTDYHPLIARAVDGLAKNTGEARRALYERARAALVTQLRSVEPALPEAEITKERLALEEAIRKVEADAARKTLAETRAPLRAEPRIEPRPAPRPARAEPRGSTPEPSLTARRDRIGPAADESGAPGSAKTGRAEPPPLELHDEQADTARPAAKASARSRILEARTTSLSREGLKGFRNVVNEIDRLGTATTKAAQTARDTRDSYALRPRQPSPEPDEFPRQPSQQEWIEPHFEDEHLQPAEDETPQAHRLEPTHILDDEQVPFEEHEATPELHSEQRHPLHGAEFEEEEYEETHPPRSYAGWARLAVLLIILLGVVGTVSWQWSNITAIYHFVTQMKSRAPTQTAQTGAAQQAKDLGRVPQEQLPGQTPAAGAAPGSQALPGVAQRAILYEADPNDPQGKRFAGSVVWRTETVSPGPGLAPELAVRADIAIPERHMTVTWSLRRNTDKALPASHTIEIMFNLPSDFPSGSISNIPGILMKDSEEVRGMPLAALAVKVTNGFFLLGLNAADADMQRNIQLLKDRSWFDVLIVYSNGGRAILTLEKGPPGERAFADAFAAWGN